MASASSLLSEEQFLCSICLDVFNRPVTIPCGHNYCKTCITQHWDSKVSQYQCPMCNQPFNTRPELRVNTFISEMAAQFKKSVKLKDSSQSNQHSTELGDVSCDVCTETKLKAVKSCLVCVASYCETHLDLHQTVTGVKKHLLINPMANLEARLRKKHDRTLEMFCKTEEVCVCLFCSELDHKLHLVVPLKEGYDGKKAQMEQTEAEVQQMIQERRLKIQQIQRSVKLREDNADRQLADGVKVFSDLMQAIKMCQVKLIASIHDQQKSTERQAEGLIKELEKEITELTKRRSKLEKLLCTLDHLHLLQSLPSLNPLPHTQDWTKINVHQPSYVGTARRAIDEIEKTVNVEMKKLHEAELNRVQQDAVNLTLDAETAYPYLVLSEDGKQVYNRGVLKKLKDNPERFTGAACVLGKQSLSSGRFYFEVEVKEKTDWDIGVARESVKRKGTIQLSPNNGFWSICLRNKSEYKAATDPVVRLSVRETLQKVGVFVDYEGGLVSFYNVEKRVHSYSFSGCMFTEPLYPYLSPYINKGGKNYVPLIITPVNKRLS